ncbi:MAG: hypothetical protein JW880_03565 [Candidatus Thermoplasmatota archaeon]|nr:hypothetical protein [Candidatus Thermoplasmatota archaeon]
MPKKKKMPRLRLKARIASKVMEKDLIEKAKMLRDDPELIFPDCANDCRSCPFKKTRARILKISRFKDDPAMLARFARRGDRLARAYAATIGLVHEEKTPYLATAKYPAGTVAFAVRGKTDKEKLIGVQYFDSPKWRVLSVSDLVKKKGLHFYSYGDNFVCTGREAKPPEEYVKLAAESVGATRVEAGSFVCPHNPRDSNHIEFDWTSAGKKVLVCDQCAAKSKNTLVKLAEGMAVPRVLNEFDIAVKRTFETVAGGGGCDDIFDRPLKQDLLERYSSGQIGDKELIEEHVQSAKESLSDVARRLYIRGERCFGEDLEAFVADMTNDELEQRALLGLLADVGNPVYVEQGDSVNKLLSMFWSEEGMAALKAVVPEDLARKYFENEDSAQSPLKAVRQAAREAEHTVISSGIPTYASLSQYGKFVDEVVRAYKTVGAEGAVSVLDGDTSSDHRLRSIAHGMYLALGVTTKSWKFTDEEKEFGRHLQSSAKKLLNSKGLQQHHEAFSRFLGEAGCPDELKRER